MKTYESNVSVERARSIIIENKENPDFVILDVRMDEEVESGHIVGMIHIDFFSPSFKESILKLDPAKTYLVYCGSGNRSARAQTMMMGKGFDRVINMLGGFGDWVEAGFESEQ